MNEKYNCMRVFKFKVFLAIESIPILFAIFLEM